MLWVIGAIGCGHLAVALRREASLREAGISVIENGHQGRFIVGHLQRVAACDVAGGRCRDGHCLCAIGVAVIDRRNLKRGAARAVENRDRRRHGRFTHIVARERGL